MTTDTSTATIDMAYLDSLAAKAAPAWAGVDADKWLDSVRGVDASAAKSDREICQGCGEYEDECACAFSAAWAAFLDRWETTAMIRKEEAYAAFVAGFNTAKTIKP